MTASTPAGTKLLQDARDTISNPKHWTQDANARTSDGRPTCPSESDADKFCMMGALYRQGPHAYHLMEAVKRLLSQMPFSYIPAFNDNRKHSEVLDVFDRAIALEEY